MSDSVRPHRRQATRLPRPWDSPGKNTGVGCHFLLQCMKVKSVRLFMTPWTAAYQAPPSMGFSRQEDWSGVPLPLHVQCNPYQNIKGSFRRTRTNNLKFCMEIEKAPNSQNNLGKEETVLRKRTELEESCSLTSDYTTKIQQSAVIKTV